MPTSPCRLAALALLLAGLGAAPAQAQTPCTGGMAGIYPCDGVNLLARLSLAELGAPPVGSCGPYAELCAAEVWGWVDPLDGREIAVVAVANGTAFVDVTTATAPVVLGRLPSATGTTNWRTLRVYADHAFVGSEASGHGIQVFDLTRLRDVQSPPQTFTADAHYTGNGNAHTLVIDEDTGFLYIAGSRNGSTGCTVGGLHIVDVRDPRNPTFAGCFDDDGYTHEAQCLVYHGPDQDYAGRELCVAYNQDHVAFVDVTDKAGPALISRAFYPNTGYTHQGWFTEDKRYILLNDEFDPAVPGTRTIVLDVEDLDAPEFAFNYFGPLGTAAHNLYIRGPYAFLSNYTGGLHILDLSGIDAQSFTEVGFFDTYPSGNAFNYAGQWMNYPFFPSGIVVATDGAQGLFVLDPGALTTAAEPPAAPGTPLLSAPVPNPADGRSLLVLTVPAPVEVVAEVLDLRGRRVALLYEGTAAPAAPVTLTVDGAGLPAGLYLVRVTGPGFSATRRLSLVH